MSEVMGDEAEARRQAAAKVLEERLSAIVGQTELTWRSMHQARRIIDHHREQARAAGVDFPVLTIIPLPKRRSMKVVLADATVEDIQRNILVVIKENPGVTHEELVAAFRWAYPTARPDIPALLH